MEGRPAELTERPAWSIRPGRHEDLPACIEVEVAAGALFRTVGLDSVADDDPGTPEELAPAVDEGRLWVAVAGDPERVVGYAYGIDLGGRPHLEQVSVDPAFGRRGIGRALIHAVEAWARHQGADELTLSTFRDVPFNGPYYASLGFEPIAAEDLTEAQRWIVTHEQELGLDVSRRELMRLPLGPA